MRSKFLLAFLLIAGSVHSLEHVQKTSTYVVQQDRLDNLEKYLQKTVPGLSVSYRTVINTLVDEGFDVYIRGGAMRDLLNLDPSDPNDVDFDYSGTPEQLKEIVERHQWMYTQIPGRTTIVIGDHRKTPMEAVPMSVAFNHGGSTLEFTVNNIFYNCNQKKIVEGTEIGVEDLDYKRLHIITSNWKAWLYRKGRHPYRRIFRSWNMIGKGFSYPADFGIFLQREASNKQRRFPDFFKSEMMHYLGSHFESFDTVYYGAISIMGYKWAQENLLPLKSEAEEKSLQAQEVRDSFTFYKGD